jgi:methyltransferase-like protein
VRQSILSLCARCLAPTGVAYASFNTSPGWHLRGVLRQLLLYHVRDVAAPRERLAAGRELLERFQEGLAGSERLAQRGLRELIADVLGRDPGYWYHEYMEAANDPALFADFAAAAAGHGLQYLCDARPFNIHTASIAEPARAWLASVGDPVEQEQLLDFLELRPFRRALICREGLPVDRDPGGSLLEQLAASADVAARGKVDLRLPRPVPFVRFDGRPAAISHPLMKAALAFLGEVYPSAVPVAEVVRRARNAVLAAGNQRIAEQTPMLAGEILALFRNGTLDLHLEARSYPAEAPDRARLHALARSELAADLDHVTGVGHRPVPMDPFSRTVAACLDGTRSRADVMAALAAELERGTLSVLPQAGEPRMKPEKALARHYQHTVALFARNGLFEPQPEAPAAPPTEAPRA